ncbi:serpin B6-like isoform X2 [Bubalus kerabau]|uniref:serpin B6-like isoform X2 n=1 Tax=Bubalus carabanensis TaxID=3119969 RepID=UPI00244EDEB5|nr:serpin B6-like isoform X2 [Bubalus carabanensis]
MDALSEANGTFALTLLKKLGEGNSKNVLIAPLSISSALAMVLMGARGNTAARMCQVRSGSRSWGSEDVHQDFQNLLSEVNRTDTQYLLRTANRLFGEKTYDFLSSFKNACRIFYQAEMEELDFVCAMQESTKHINTWVLQKTEGKIRDLLPANSVNPMTRLVLVSAVYFKGNWAKPFLKGRTMEGIFNVCKNVQKRALMIYNWSTFKTACIAEICSQILVLPYVGQELNMVILLPFESTDLITVEKALTYEKFVAWTKPDVLAEVEVEVFLPCFTLEECYDMECVLRDLGMTDAFNAARADFSGMSCQPGLHLSKVMHKSFVEVTAEGTEATAASEARIRQSLSVVHHFYANRPFLFFIQHGRTGAILFCGRFCSP